MTHTVHPYAHRLGIIREWKSRWFAGDKKTYRENILVDESVRRYVNDKMRAMHIADVEIERSQSEVHVVIHTARPGLVIGRSGENATKIRKELTNVIRKVAPNHGRTIKLDIMEIRQPETNAMIVAQMVAEGLEKRLPFRRVLKGTVEKIMAVREVLGVRIVISGRLGGADMSRIEQIKRGRIPLQTFRANIDYAHFEAHLPYGQIGIKVLVYLGDVFEGAVASNRDAAQPASQSTGMTARPSK